MLYRVWQRAHAQREDPVDESVGETEPVEGSELEAGPANEPSGAQEDAEGEEGEGARVTEVSAVPWTRILQDLKARRPAVAAVYEGARLEGFDGRVLELSFPEELAIYVKLAGEPKRLDSLREVLEEHLGASPRLEFRVGDGAPVEVAPPQREQLPPAEVPRAEPADRRAETPTVRDAGDERPEISGVVDGPEAQGAASGETGSEDVIRDQREVFEMARERFGQDEGS